MIGSGSLIEMSLNMNIFNATFLNVYQYDVAELVPNVPTVAFAEAWWNHVKTGYRALCVTSSFAGAFRSVRIRELNNSVGELAEYNIPTGEQSGTRTPPSASEPMPPFCAAGVRLSVGSRLTRAGQKRFPFLLEADANAQTLQAAYQALLVSLLNTLTADMVFGAPAVGVVLRPIVCRKDAAGTVVSHQPVTGYVINQFVTTQNTRKIGRGV